MIRSSLITGFFIFFLGSNVNAAEDCEPSKEFPQLHEKIIKPLQENPDFTVKLTGFDQFNSATYVSMALAFPSLIDPKVIEEALAMVQESLPEFGSRIVTDKHTRGPAMHFVGSQGIQFEFRSIDDPEQKGSLEGLKIPAMGDSAEMNPKDWIALDAVRQHQSPPRDTDPLTYFRLTHLLGQNVSIVGLCVNHGLGDAATYSLFLQALSYYAGIVAGVKPIPEKLPSFPKERQRYLGPQTCEVESQKEDIFCSNLGMLTYIPRFIYRLSTYESMNFRVAKQGLSQLKKDLTAELKKEDPSLWVSSYEVLMSSVLEGIHYAQGPRPDPLSLKIIINLRNRCEGYRSNYIGNAIATQHLSIDRNREIEGYKGDLSWLINPSKHFHYSLRNFIDDKPKCQIPPSFELMQKNGNTPGLLNFMIPLMAGRNDPLMINNWTGYNFLELDFGSGVKATTFGIPMDFPPGMIQLNPRYSSDAGLRSDEQTLIISLPKWQARKFKEFVRERNLPLTLI